MKDCTRSSHSFLLADIVKSIGTLLSAAKLLGRTLCLLPLRRKGLWTVAAKAARCRSRNATEFRGLTFSGFETIVSYNCLNCNPPQEHDPEKGRQRVFRIGSCPVTES